MLTFFVLLPEDEDGFSRVKEISWSEQSINAIDFSDVCCMEKHDRTNVLYRGNFLSRFIVEDRAKECILTWRVRDKHLTISIPNGIHKQPDLATYQDLVLRLTTKSEQKDWIWRCLWVYRPWPQAVYCDIFDAMVRLKRGVQIKRWKRGL